MRIRFPEKLLGLFVVFLFLSIVFVVLLEAEFSRPYDERVKIMLLGDSITAGSHGTVGYRRNLYLDLVNSGFNVDFVGSQSAGSGFDADHEGHGWQTASYFNSRLNGPAGYLLTANPPDVILYHIGTNSLGGSDVVSYALAANETLRIIYEYDPDITVILAKIILTTDSARNSRTHNYNLLLEEYAQYWSDNGYSIIVVDMENTLVPALYPAGDLADIVHPTTAGYEKIADVWYDALDDILPVSVLPEGMIAHWKLGILICLLLLILALFMKIFSVPRFWRLARAILFVSFFVVGCFYFFREKVSKREFVLRGVLCGGRERVGKR